MAADGPAPAEGSAGPNTFKESVGWGSRNDLQGMGNMRKENISDGQLAAELLQRNSPPIYGEDAQRLITGKKIIVTGAGGSIGSEIVRQLKRIDPNCKVYFIDNSEYALYLLQLSLEGRPLLTQPEYILADITNRKRMHEIFAMIQPDMCFHAEAW